MKDDWYYAEDMEIPGSKAVVSNDGLMGNVQAVVKD